MNLYSGRKYKGKKSSLLINSKQSISRDLLGGQLDQTSENVSIDKYYSKFWKCRIVHIQTC